MAERSAYAPGTFCWAELSTSDTAGALEFYGSLLGWDGEEMPIPSGGSYTMLRLADHDVAGMATLREDQRAAGVPPHWLSYVAVEDVDVTTDRAAGLGATVLAGPFDVMDAGRMAVTRDPQGAHLALWQAGAHPGAGLVNDPGAMCLNQLNTHSPKDAARFYRDLFGWEIGRVKGVAPYWGIRNGGALNGGMMALPAEAPPHWLVYFTTEDVEDAAEAIARLGGQVVVPPMKAGAEGRILVASDPQGAHFALFEGRTDP
jgi:uncharacterized protein